MKKISIILVIMALVSIPIFADSKSYNIGYSEGVKAVEGGYVFELEYVVTSYIRNHKNDNLDPREYFKGFYDALEELQYPIVDLIGYKYTIKEAVSRSMILYEVYTKDSSKS